MQKNKHPLVLRWFNEGSVSTNWGDKLNPVLVSELSGRSVEAWTAPSRIRMRFRRLVEKLTRGRLHLAPLPWCRPAYLVIGSGLASADANTIVWGQGFGFENEEVASRPKKICAVRGPLSRQKLRSAGYVCPDVVGDPAVVYALIYRPIVEEEFDFGIIRHFREDTIEPPRLPAKYKTRVIDIAGGINQVIDEILSCKAILSSSLHGIIAAHAYGVPAGWFSFRERQRVDDFKFRDYWASIGCNDAACLGVHAGAESSELADLPRFPNNELDIRSLLEACPFLSDDRRHLLKRCHLAFTRPTRREAASNS
jgi:pyruvyltransferase